MGSLSRLRLSELILCTLQLGTLLLQQCLGRLRTLALLSELLPLQLVECAMLCQLAQEALVAAWRSEVRPVAWCRCWCEGRSVDRTAEDIARAIRCAHLQFLEQRARVLERWRRTHTPGSRPCL